MISKHKLNRYYNGNKARLKQLAAFIVAEGSKAALIGLAVYIAMRIV